MKSSLRTQSNRLSAVALLALLTAVTFVGCSQDPSTHFWKAVDAFKAKEYKEADNLARKTLALQPDYVPAYLLLARTALVQEDQKSAEINYRNAFDMMTQRNYKLRAEDVRAAESDQRIQWQESAFFLADVEFRTMNYQRAEPFYEAVIQDRSDPSMRKLAMDDKQSVRDVSELRRRLDALRGQNMKNPDDPRIQAELSGLFMEMASAMARLRKMKSVSEQVALAGKFREQAREALGEVYEASPELRLPQTEALLDYTESQEKLMRGHYEEALQKAMDATENDPQNGKYQFTVSSILAVLADKIEKDPNFRMDDRLEYTRKAVEFSPEMWRYRTAYAGLLRELGRSQEAYEQLIVARESAKDPETVGQIDEALAEVEKELAVVPAAGSGE